jgi:REP element-mobilizing transposase RayT
MENKFLHVRKSPRLKCWDYSNPHWYFITICTDNHTKLFGRIEKEKMVLNKLGQYAETCLKTISDHYQNAELDYYVIMPNHIHAIIIINPVEMRHGISKQNDNQELRYAPTSQKITLGNIIGSFKSAVTKWAHQNFYKNFKWQRSFYDRIIRNEKELYQIRKYIEQNPLAWDLEKSITENLCL